MAKAEMVPIRAAEVAKFKRGGTEIVEIADSLVVSAKAEENDAYDILKRIKTLSEEIESRRTSITKPLNASLRAANALFKPLSSPLKTAKDIIKGKIVDFQDEQEEKAAKQQAIRDKVEATRQAKGVEYEEAEPVTPDVGESTITKRWAYDVKDLSKVPREYLALNTSVIWTAIRNGVRDIPGLKIYQEKNVSVRD